MPWGKVTDMAEDAPEGDEHRGRHSNAGIGQRTWQNISRRSKAKNIKKDEAECTLKIICTQQRRRQKKCKKT
jgi:hypothetical protein